MTSAARMRGKRTCTTTVTCAGSTANVVPNSWFDATRKTSSTLMPYRPSVNDTSMTATSSTASMTSKGTARFLAGRPEAAAEEIGAGEAGASEAGASVAGASGDARPSAGARVSIPFSMAGAPPFLQEPAGTCSAPRESRPTSPSFSRTRSPPCFDASCRPRPAGSADSTSLSRLLSSRSHPLVRIIFFS